MKTNVRLVGRAQLQLDFVPSAGLWVEEQHVEPTRPGLQSLDILDVEVAQT